MRLFLALWSAGIFGAAYAYWQVGQHGHQAVVLLIAGLCSTFVLLVLERAGR